MTFTSCPTGLGDRRDRLNWLIRNWRRCGDEVRVLILATSCALTPEDRRDDLRWLARDCGSAGQEEILTATVHPSMAEPLLPTCTCGICLTCIWYEYLHDLALADGIEAGTIMWEDINPDLTGPDRTEAARAEIWSRVAGGGGLEDVLLNGVEARWRKDGPVPQKTERAA